MLFEVFFGSCDLRPDEDEGALGVWASPWVNAHHVSFLWHAQSHVRFGHPACSAVDGNAQKPERDMSTRIDSATVTFRRLGELSQVMSHGVHGFGILLASRKDRPFESA